MKQIKLFWKPHPDSKLQIPWYLTQLGLLIFPIIPSLGAISLIFASIQTWRREYRKIVNRPLNRGFAFLSILLIVTTVLADDKITAFLGLFNFLPFFLFFTAFGILIQTTTQLRQLSWILVIGSMPVIIIGIGHMFFGWSTSKFWEIILGWKLEQGINPITRMGSLMMNSNLLAAYLAIVLVLGFGLWIQNWQKIKKINKKANNKKFIISSFPTPFIFLTLILIGDFIGLILTRSRNGWGNAIVICIAYAVYQNWYWIITGVIAVVATVITTVHAPLPIAELFRKVIPEFFWIRFHSQAYSHYPAAIHRKNIWEFAFNLVLQRPWNGWGLRNFSAIFEAQTDHWLGHPHNLFLMLSAETGLPTAILFFGLLGWLFFAGVRLLQNPKSLPNRDKLIFFSYLLAFAVLIIFNTVDVTTFDFRLNTLFWLILAAVFGVVYNYNPQLKR